MKNYKKCLKLRNDAISSGEYPIRKRNKDYLKALKDGVSYCTNDKSFKTVANMITWAFGYEESEVITDLKKEVTKYRKEVNDNINRNSDHDNHSDLDHDNM